MKLFHLHVHVHHCSCVGDKLDAIYERLTLMATQTDVDTLTAKLDDLSTQLDTAVTGIQGDLDALKAANPGVDVSALSASVDRLATVAQRATDTDAENPAVPPVV